MLIAEEAVGGGAAGIWKSVPSQLNFVVKLKALQKLKSTQAGSERASAYVTIQNYQVGCNAITEVFI